MALEIGSGITLGGGISLTVESGGGGGISLGSFVDTMVDDKGDVTYGVRTGLDSFGVLRLVYNPMFEDTRLVPIEGTYSGYTVSGTSESAAFYVGATQITSISLTVDGITATIVLGSPWLGVYTVSGDPFLLVSKTGQTLAASMTFL